MEKGSISSTASNGGGWGGRTRRLPSLTKPDEGKGEKEIVSSLNREES